MFYSNFLLNGIQSFPTTPAIYIYPWSGIKSMGGWLTFKKKSYLCRLAQHFDNKNTWGRPFFDFELFFKIISNHGPKFKIDNGTVVVR